MPTWDPRFEWNDFPAVFVCSESNMIFGRAWENLIIAMGLTKCSGGSAGK